MEKMKIAKNNSWFWLYQGIKFRLFLHTANMFLSQCDKFQLYFFTAFCLNFAMAQNMPISSHCNNIESPQPPPPPQRGFMGTIACDYSRSIAENRRRSTEAYRRVMSTWPSMMVGTAEGDLPKLFSPALLA